MPGPNAGDPVSLQGILFLFISAGLAALRWADVAALLAHIGL